MGGAHCLLIKVNVNNSTLLSLQTAVKENLKCNCNKDIVVGFFSQQIKDTYSEINFYTVILPRSLKSLRVQLGVFPALRPDAVGHGQVHRETV